MNRPTVTGRGCSGDQEGTENSRQPVNGVMGTILRRRAATATRRPLHSSATLSVHEGGGLVARTPGVLTMHATGRTMGGRRDRR